MGDELATIAGHGREDRDHRDARDMFMTFFLLLDGDKAWVAATRGMSDWSRERLTRAGSAMPVESIGGYLRGTVATAIVKSVAAFALLLLVWASPIPAALAVMVFFGGFVPYVGAFVTTTLHGAGDPRRLGQRRGEPPVPGPHRGRLRWPSSIFVAPRVYRPTVRRPPGHRPHRTPDRPRGRVACMGVVLAVPTVVRRGGCAAPAPRSARRAPGGTAVSPTTSIPLWLDRIAQWSWRGLVAPRPREWSWSIAVAATVPLVLGPIVVGITLAATVAPGAEPRWSGAGSTPRLAAR